MTDSSVRRTTGTVWDRVEACWATRECFIVVALDCCSATLFHNTGIQHIVSEAELSLSVNLI